MLSHQWFRAFEFRHMSPFCREYSSLVEGWCAQVAFADETANKIQRAVLWGQADNL